MQIYFILIVIMVNQIVILGDIMEVRDYAYTVMGLSILIVVCCFSIGQQIYKNLKG